MTYEEKRRHWSCIVQEWSQSNQNQQKFCQERGLNTGTFKYWTKKMRPQVASFKPVTLRPVPEETIQIKIETPYGVKIFVPSGATAEGLRAIFTSLGIVA